MLRSRCVNRCSWSICHCIYPCWDSRAGFSSWKQRIEAGGLHPTHPSLTDPFHQGEGQLSVMNPKFTLSPVLQLEQPEHLLVWASWERKGKGGFRLCAFLCSQ